MHTPTQRKDGSYLDLNNYGFCCPVCNFKQPFIESRMFIHLRGHLKRKLFHVLSRTAILKPMYTQPSMPTNAETAKIQQVPMKALCKVL